MSFTKRYFEDHINDYTDEELISMVYSKEDIKDIKDIRESLSRSKKDEDT